MNRRFPLVFVAGAAALLLGLQAAAQSPESTATWITMGTGGGPIARLKRAQSSNVLLSSGGIVVFDAGERTVLGLARAGIRLEQVDAVVISHLHPDHTAGLAALIALRWQNGQTRPLTVYGPVGTDETVAGILASLRPAERTGFATTAPMPSAQTWLKSQEFSCEGEWTEVAGVRIKSVRNTHYTMPDGTDATGAASCSFRIEAAGRIIAYTGDTGPSEAVTEVSRGADLLVAEVIDVPATLSAIEESGAQLSPSMKEGLAYHLAHHHLVPEDVGRLASEAGVAKVVLTHFAPGLDVESTGTNYVGGVRAHFSGPVEAAEDGDRF